MKTAILWSLVLVRFAFLVAAVFFGACAAVTVFAFGVCGLVFFALEPKPAPQRLIVVVRPE